MYKSFYFIFIIESSYKSGLSLSLVAKTQQIPKSTLRDTLVQGGMPLRPTTNGMDKHDVGAPNFGHVRIDGKVVKDPKEQKIKPRTASIQMGNANVATSNAKVSYVFK